MTAAATEHVPEAKADATTVVAQRYRIDERIARGGMGSVYRAYDQRNQRPIALKRLHLEEEDRMRARMFEREYHTLAGLEHPRIIQVYDYGVDEQGPYYTMELLDGRDLRELSPLPYAEACRYLRDVASSLALLHARGLLHRDISPRNVRITTDGRAKLIDFGALTHFGRHAKVVGTPPMIAPEAAHGGELDQRADLYSLGALAYWVLTGHHAYDVRSLAELSSAWKRDPKLPSELAGRLLPEHPIPAELDELVLSLLSRNPLARPSSAAEVISRLTSIGALPPETEPLSAMSYLRGGKTIGRGRERAQLRKRLKSAHAGIGSAVLLEAESGMGAARIFSDLAMEAQLLGVTTIAVDASLHRGSYGVVQEISRVLHERLPAVVKRTMRPHAEALQRFVPGHDARHTASHNTRRSALEDARPGDPREQRLRTQEALRSWLVSLTEHAPVLVTVRNLQRADDASAALLAALAHGIATRKLLLVATINPGEPTTSQGAVQALRESAARMRLKGLSRREVALLVEATFGPVANSERLAEWLHELSSGKPQGCLDLIHHLVDHDVITFADGVWALPQDLSSAELPADLGQAMGERLDRLEPQARALASALSVHRGAITLDRCLQCAEREGVLEPLTMLERLERDEILTADAQSGEYHFVHRPVREALLARLPEDDRRRLHAELGAELEREFDGDDAQLLEAGWHLLQGGRRHEGAQLLARVGRAMAYDGDEIPAAIPALEAALEVMREEQRPAREQGPLLATLAIAGFYSDRRVLEAYGPESLDAMEQVIGLNLAARLRPWIGARLSVLLGIAWAFFGLLPFRGFNPRVAARELAGLITLYSTAATVTVGLGTLTLDARFAQQYAERLEPLSALGARTAAGLNYALARAVSKIPEDRIAQVLREIKLVLADLERDDPIPLLDDSSRRLMLGAALYTQGSLETFCDSPLALEIADRIDGFGWKVFALFANQIRANYHAQRGELDRADHFREQVELCAIQAGSGWQAEVWSGSGRLLGYKVTGDVIGLKRLAAEMERLAREIPSLHTHAQLARAAYYMERGDAERARELGHPTWSGREPRAFIGWASALAGEVHNLSVVGRAEEGVELGRWALSFYDAEDRQVSTMFSQLIAALALAEAQVGDYDGAAARIEEYLQELGERGGPGSRGVLHAARARVAIMADDLLTARVEAAHLEKWYRPTGNPAMIARVEQLRREIESASADPRQDDLLYDTLDLGAADIVHVRTLLEQCEGRQQRLDKVLELFVHETGGTTGYLFLRASGAFALAAPEHGVEPPTALYARLEQELSVFTHDANAVTVVTTEINTAIATVTGEAQALREGHSVFLLRVEDGDGELRVVGAVAIAPGERPLRAPVQAFLSGVGDSLLANGDITQFGT